MKTKFRCALAGCLIITALCLSACGNEANEKSFSTDAYTSLFLGYDYGDDVVYTIGHKSPDSDSVMSAIGLAEYLNAIGIKAEPAMSGTLNGETKYAVTELGIAEPQIVTDGKGKSLFLVDNSDYAQAVDGADEANIVGIIDHHGIGSVNDSQMINVISAPVGSTCTLVYRLFVESGIEISQNAADALIVGLLSDTKNFTGLVTELDKEAFEQLKKYSSIKDTETLYGEMANAKRSYLGMNDTEIFYSDYKDYEYDGLKYGVACIEVTSVSDIDPMSDRMKKIMEESFGDSGLDFLTILVNDSNYEKAIFSYIGKDQADTYELMQEAFGSIAAEVSEDYVLFTPSVGRKKVIVPQINDTIHAGLYGLSE